MAGDKGRHVEHAVLVVGPSWIGDMVMAQTLFRLLEQEAEGPVRIDVLAPAWSRPLLRRMPEVSTALDSPFAHGQLGLKARYRLGRQLRSAGYRQAIVLPNSFKSALVPWFARIPVRTGWRGEMRDALLNDCRRLDRQRYPQMVQRFAALALAPGQPLPPLPRPMLATAESDVHDALQAMDLSLSLPVLALCPGAEFGDAKRWPVSHYAELADQWLEGGWQVWLFGSDRDRAVTAEIVRLLPPAHRDRCHDIAGRTTLGQAVDLLSVAGAVVSNDSGLMHIAAALDRPLVAVYGSTSFEFTPPLSDRARLLATDIGCRPCFQRRCPLGHGNCLKRLPPAFVSGQLRKLLDGAPGDVAIYREG